MKPARKLIDLNPSFYGAGGPGVSRADGSPSPERSGIGLMFDCPCGTCGEMVAVGFSNPIDGGPVFDPSRPSWERTGDRFESLTLKPSILRTTGCKWHGWVTNGEVTTC